MNLFLRSAALLAFAATAACAPVAPPPKATPAAMTASAETLTLKSADGRTVPVLLVAPAQPLGVVLFSHGGGTPLAGVRPVIDRLVAAGFAVAAPTHTDSLDQPAETRTTMQDAFPTRVGDMIAVSAFAAQRFPGLAQAAAGHSYGALTGLMAGGAFAPMVPAKVDAVKAVVMFSSPGPIPGLSQAPGPLDGVTVPTLLVTGTADTVPGFVSDPALHLFYFDRLPEGDHTVLIVKGATHEFVAGKEAGFNETWALAIDFLKARIAGDAAAAKRFAAATGGAQVEVRRR